MDIKAIGRKLLEIRREAEKAAEKNKELIEKIDRLQRSLHTHANRLQVLKGLEWRDSLKREA